MYIRPERKIETQKDVVRWGELKLCSRRKEDVVYVGSVGGYHRIQSRLIGDLFALNVRCCWFHRNHYHQHFNRLQKPRRCRVRALIAAGSMVVTGFSWIGVRGMVRVAEAWKPPPMVRRRDSMTRRTITKTAGSRLASTTVIPPSTTVAPGGKQQ
jgi:hypothetical protein